MANKLEANIVALALIHGSPTFIVRIKYFKYKMETWPSAKSIITKIGTVGGVSLSLQIYPNGLNVKDKGNVSVSLVNSNDFKIQVDYTFKMKDKERSFSKVDFEPKKVGDALIYIVTRMMPILEVMMTRRLVVSSDV